MLKEKTAIGPGLFFALTFSVIYGYGMLLAPVLAIQHIGNNGYWGVILAYLMFLLVLYATFKLAARFPGKSLIEYLPAIFGTFIGKILGLLYILMALTLTSLSLRLAGEVMNTYFLFRTPLAVIMGVTLLAIAYTVSLGIEAISRLASFILAPALLFIIVGIALAFQNFDLQSIKPVFLVDYTKLAGGTMHLTNIFFPGLVLLFVLQYLTNNRAGAKNAFIATSLASFLILVVVVTTIGVYGAKGALRYNWPFFEMNRMTEIPLIQQTFGVFYSIAWFSQMYISICGFYHTTSQGLTELTGFFNYKRFALLLFPIILILAIYPPSIVSVREIFNAIRPVGFLIIIVGPIVIWLASLILRRRADENEEKVV